MTHSLRYRSPAAFGLPDSHMQPFGCPAHVNIFTAHTYRLLEITQIPPITSIHFGERQLVRHGLDQCG